MKKYYCLLVFAFIGCLLIGCDKEQPILEETDPPLEKLEPTEEEMYTILIETGRYTEGEHSCYVEVSHDSYSYPNSGSNNYQVPIELIDTMSTLGLIETILENPHFPTWGGNGRDLKEGIWSFNYMVPGILEELYSRDDATTLLINKYIGMYFTCEDNNYSSPLGKGIPEDFVSSEYNSQQMLAFANIQILLLQYEILQKATDEEINTLSLHLVRTLLTVKNGTSYSFLSNLRVTSNGLAARIMYCEEFKPFLDILEIDKKFQMANLDSPSYLPSPIRAKYMLLFNDFIGERLNLD